MKTALLTGIRKMEIRDVPRPESPGPGRVLLKTRMVGICGSDLHYYTEGRIGGQSVAYPFRMGHECVAEVMTAPGGQSRLKSGDRVAVDPAVSCSRCNQCKAGRPHTCLNLKFMGAPGQMPGALAEYFTMPVENCYPFGGEISLQAAVMAEPLSIAIHAFRLLNDPFIRTVGILGSGPIGLCVLSESLNESSRSVFVTYLADYRIEAALRMGASWGGNPDRIDVSGEVLKREPDGLDAVFECCGDEEALDQGIVMLKPGGKLVVVGIPAADRVRLDIHALRRKEISVIHARRQNGCMQPAIERVRRDPALWEGLVTHLFALEDSGRAFETAARRSDGVIKAVIVSN